jgi:hypothetical protein
MYHMKGALNYQAIERMPYWERRELFKLLVAQREKENAEAEEQAENARSGAGRDTGGRRSLLSKPMSKEEAHGASAIERQAPNQRVAERVKGRAMAGQDAQSSLQARIDARASEISARRAAGKPAGPPANPPPIRGS